MSVATLNGFVLIPHAPDWNVKPRFRREWKSRVSDSVTGAEDRISFRHLPLRGVEFQVTPFTFQEYRRLVSRILAARKSGWAAVPLWGRGSVLAAPASGDVVTLASEEAWPWASGDFAFFSNLEPGDPDAFQVREVTGVSGATLTLDQPLARTYRRFCWPVILGRFSSEDVSTLTSRHGTLRISVLERDVRPEPNADLCAILLVGDGGGDNFDCYAPDVALNGLGAGSYFSGAWVDETLFVGIQDADSLDGYVPGTGLHNQAKGSLWGGPWVDDNLFVSLRATDSFDPYGSGVPLDTLASGTGFAAPWTDSNLG